MPGLADRRLLLPRIVGALALRAAVYARLGADPRASWQAATIVVLVALIEASATAAAHGERVLDGLRVVVALVAAAIGWTVWTLLVQLVGVRVFGHAAAAPAIARAVGFAYAPGLLLGIALVPGGGLLVGSLYLLSLLWFGAALHAAVRGLFEVSGRRAVAILALAFLAHEAVRQAARLAGVVP